MQFFKLRKHHKTCELCRSQLQFELYSSLSDEELRKDYCFPCFQIVEKPQIWWKTTIELKAKEICVTEYEQKLYAQFILALEEKSKNDEWIYFLAHYFKRRKVFQSQGECEKEGTLYEILESKLTQEVYVIPKSPPSGTSLKAILQDVYPS